MSVGVCSKVVGCKDFGTIDEQIVNNRSSVGATVCRPCSIAVMEQV